jgi:hypothetical protein
MITRRAPGSALTRSGWPALSGAAKASVSPSAATGMARSVVTVTVTAWYAVTCASST